ncbi:MAG: type II toxin-antitoxin system antitoxin SocA domain-containing protein, partial [Thermodesulfobacteriota bacterium]
WRRSMPPTSAKLVADYILCFAHECGDLITNLKLQKLLYYAQAWYLALYDEPLFPDPLEAWVHGPVQPGQYHRFKEHKWNPISEEPECSAFSAQVKSHLDDIMDVYGDLTAHHLERLVHQEDPWIKARKGLPPDAPCNNPISWDDMKAFYKGVLGGQDQEARQETAG